jgi:hypothetical protein
VVTFIQKEVPLGDIMDMLGHVFQILVLKENLVVKDRREKLD